MPRDRFEYLDPEYWADHTVDTGIQTRSAAADEFAERWPTGPLDLYDDPLMDREPVCGDPYWAGDLEW